MGRVLIPATCPKDWQRLLADPEKQWKKGFSARTIAHCWQEADGIPGRVKSVLSKSPDLAGLEALVVIPEHQVPLPGGSRPSQNDVWVLARTHSELVSIAVEGKVSEPFGPTVSEWNSDPSEGKKERLEYLCDELGLDCPPGGDVRYQLLHRTVSAVIEAKRFHARHAVMVVHSFSQKKEWFEDYERFLLLFKVQAAVDEVVTAGRRGRVILHFAWVCGDKRYLDAWATQREIREMKKKPANVEKKNSGNVVIADAGLLPDEILWHVLKDYPQELVAGLRKRLAADCPRLREKINRKSRYLGYSNGGSDAIYVYVRKNDLLIDIRLSADLADDLRRAGFEVRPRDNYQGKSGWLTGLIVPHDTDKAGDVAKLAIEALSGQ